jgi:formyltetrahydrofolate deformylase
MLGTVDVVTRYLYEQRCYVTEHHSFDDRLSGRFFIRVEFRQPDDFDEAGFRAGLAERSDAFGMTFELTAPNHRPKVVIMVSKADHCLNDLLYRQRIGQLAMDVVAVVSNHPDLEPLAQWHKIPYYHFALDPKDKPAQERKVLQVIEETGAELVILARYMQVLSPELCRRLDGWAINIHHSLLPGFKGAKPYHQAYNKGVKMVGATAHYINNDLDEGPIIAQGVEVVDHSHYPEDLIAKGRDIECLTLARAVGYHIERRVFLNANRTVVL